MELFLNKEKEETKDLRKPIEENHLYDLVILGGGPAGLTAALYALRKKMDTALISYDLGGQMLKTWDLENYPGFLKIGGFELTQKMEKQAVQFPVAFEEGAEVKKITKNGAFKVELDNGKTIDSKTVLIATGKRSRPLGVPGEEEYTGKGVAYCATCDAPLFKNKKTMVVGGGNSGVEAALELSKIASEVYLVEIMNHLLADEILVDKLKGAPNVKVLLETKVTKIQGDQFVNEVNLVNVQTEKTEKVEIDGIFIEIGLIPNTEFQTGFELEKNPWNEIVVNNKCETNIEGLFAAGDVTNVPEKQVIISAGEGAKAALTAFKYLQHQ